MVTVHVNDELTAYAGLSPDVLPDLLLDMNTYELNLMLHLIGLVQTRVSAPRRENKERARDETIMLCLYWVKAVTHMKDYTKTKNFMLGLDRVRIGRTRPLAVEWVDGGFQVTVTQGYAYPPHFIRVPLPIIVGDARLTRVWLTMWAALHHGRRQPIPLRERRPLQEEDVLALNRHLRKLNSDWHLARNKIIVPTRLSLSVEQRMQHLVLTMPKDHGN